MRVLVVNIHFDPVSFGGATVVAERMADAIHQTDRIEVVALSARFANLPAPSIVRYRSKFGFDAFSIGVSLPNPENERQAFDNPEFTGAFNRVLDEVKPDVVHIHCIQDMGAGIFDCLIEKEIPFVVTVHDFWWVCERQFMINLEGEYCGQTKIDYQVCAGCSGSATRSKHRADYLKKQLSKANMILAVSQFTHDMLIANGLPADRVHIHKNGVVAAGADYVARRRSRAPDDPIHFGFCGGPGAIKGWDLIVSAFEPMDRERYKVLAVDAGSLVGASWRNELQSASDRINIEVLPGYSGSDQLDQTFAQFDVLLFPSRWKETFGLTVREALIRDIWVIASDAGGAAEDIVDGINGQVLSFPPTVEQLAQAVEQFDLRRAGQQAAPVPLVQVEQQSDQLISYLQALVPDEKASNAGTEQL